MKSKPVLTPSYVKLTVEALRAGGLPDPITRTVTPSSYTQSQCLNRGSNVVDCGLGQILWRVLYLHLSHTTLEI